VLLVGAATLTRTLRHDLTDQDRLQRLAALRLNAPRVNIGFLAGITGNFSTAYSSSKRPVLP
jgi:hypothetical protein